MIYEVNIDIDADVFDKYVVWLRKHMSEMLSLEYFEAATLYRVEADSLGEDGKRSISVSVHYQVASREKLEQYFLNHAKPMRSDAIEKFGTKFSATRRVLTEDFSLG
ncbi:MAG: DUF4286 family protein [Bdellovibrionota bacterium]